jgi:hypothetical protein
MSSTTKRARAIVMAIIAVLTINFAISYASGIPTFPSSPKPRTADSGIPTFPSSPRP